jgi:hypothetical protein
MNEIGRRLIEIINNDFFCLIDATEQSCQEMAEAIIEFMESEGYKYCKECSGHKYRC